MDHENTDFSKALADIQSFAGEKAVPVQLPIGNGPDFSGYIDIIENKAFMFENDKIRATDVPDEYYADVQQARGSLCEIIAEFDDELLDKLDAAKLNEDLYRKEVTELRNYYKQIEDSQLAEREQIRQSEMHAFENNVAEVLSRFNAIPLDPSDVNCDALAIEDADKDRIASYLFDTDANGQSQLVKDLSDPAALVELAFFRTQRNLLTDMANY
jgi:translation elongation factor EF-G